MTGPFQIVEGDRHTIIALEEHLRRGGNLLGTWGMLCEARTLPVASYWHRNLWTNTVRFPFESIGKTAKTLRSLATLWVARPQAQFRRHELIQNELPRFHPRPRTFPFVPPRGSIGVWTLGNDGQVWACTNPENPFPGGDPRLEENTIDPPSSAYRKLQEALCLCGHWPGPEEKCIDAGSSPGGWTWVLAQLGARVVSVDRAPLDSRLLSRPNVEFSIGNAFTVLPESHGPVDWLVSDVICYPEKLWSWIKTWLDAKGAKHFVVTVKLQGTTIDWKTLDQFASVPQSRLVHLFHNKNELTWLHPITNR